MVIFICAFFSVLLGVLLGLFVGFFLFGLFGFQRKSRVKNDIPSPKREIIEPQESQESIKSKMECFSPHSPPYPAAYI